MERMKAKFPPALSIVKSYSFLKFRDRIPFKYLPKELETPFPIFRVWKAALSTVYFEVSIDLVR